MAKKKFLDIHLLSTETLRSIIEHAKQIKSGADTPYIKNAKGFAPTLVMIFDKPSTRTRISFDVAMRQIGGETIVINSSDMQIGRGETLADTAKIISRYSDIIMLRTTDHKKLEELAYNSTIPVVNGLTDKSHPCQILGDIMTFEEKLGPIQGKSIAWIGDGNNVANSWIHAAARLDFRLVISCPSELSPDNEILDWAQRENANVQLITDPLRAVSNADCVVTDVWVSMGDSNAERRYQLLRPYQVNRTLMAEAKNDAIFMHCLPAQRGDEVSADVIDGPQSVVFDEAENRLHIQKAILTWCLNNDG